MPKYIVKEGILDKFLGGVFGAIGKGAAKKVVKQLEFDPVLQKKAREIDKLRSDMVKRVETNAKKSPEAAKEYEEYLKSMRARGLPV
jgi:hypothetical protein